MFNYKVLSPFYKKPGRLLVQIWQLFRATWHKA